jgi:hypothetical protein
VMLLTPESLRLLFSIGLLGMVLLAVFYLLGRRLSFWQFLGWGLLVIFIPLLGPFLAIICSPGQSRN